jgi:hypothetical protein
LGAGKWSATRERVSEPENPDRKNFKRDSRPLLGMRFLHDVFGEGFAERRICEPHFKCGIFEVPRERAILVRDFKVHQNEHVKKFALFQGSEKQCTF